MGSFKLGTMTLKGLFKKPETIQYPAQVKPMPEGLKGHIVINTDLCILCSLCARRCPCNAIEVDKKARTWSINRFQCVQCGSCARECPKHCLTMDPHYTTPSKSIRFDTFEIAEREKEPAKRQSAPAKVPTSASNPAPVDFLPER